MFIRWQTRKRNHANYGNYWRSDVTWFAILVEAIRVDGKPRQKHVAYLGSFTESQLALPSQRVWMWDGMTERLDRLDNRIAREDRKSIEAALAKRLGPRPTKRQREAAQRRSDRVMRELLEQFGGADDH